ncbi:hypothetical protein [Desulfovibrio subterraneus]|jgi:hypothetical protein|uniref:Uncharacterized protein n=1 Tax=Desulfovibrio subterraneus TaxID=2718620 RepID=A0A7J0BIL4_9BACT|nr:hypothetical protein [Desulfovibrio subterraneus]GFM33613.1 hypothetical protein DSM101010T_19780 [Desulfovibrio subterraneus]
MKWVLLAVLAAGSTLGIIYGYFTFANQPSISYSSISIDLQVVYPDDTPDHSLSDSDIETIRTFLRSNHNLFKSSTLYMNCYPKQAGFSNEDQVNFQLVIVCNNGCIYESKRTYTTDTNLTRKIIEKFSTAFSVIKRNEDSSPKPSKITF